MGAAPGACQGRKRIEAAFAGAAARRITLVCASNGAGKSTAIAGHVRDLDGRAAHYVAEIARRGLAAFMLGLTGELSGSFPTLKNDLARALATAARATKPATMLAGWFVEHLGAREVVIALDDLHLIEECDEVREFIVAAIALSGPRTRWILGIRGAGPFPVDTWRAAGLVDEHIDDACLRITTEEAIVFAERVGYPKNSALTALSSSSGHAGGLMLALARADALPLTAAAVRNASTAEVALTADDFATAVEAQARHFVQRMSNKQRRALHALMLLPELDPQLVDHIPCGSQILANIAREAPYALWPCGSGRFTRTFESIVMRETNAGVLAAGAALAIAALEASARRQQAFDVALRTGAANEVVRLIERYGFALVAGRSCPLADVLAVIAARGAPSQGFVASALAAMLESERGNFRIADTLFERAIAGAPNALTRSRVQYLYAGSLFRRGRSESISLLERIVKVAPAPELTISAMAMLASAYTLTERWQEARTAIDEALRQMATVEDIATRLCVYQSAAYVACAERNADQIGHYAELTLSLADERGDDEVAVVAHSLRYVVASYYRDDVCEALRVIESLKACAQRLTDASLVRSALLGLIESHGERGDEAEVEKAEDALALLEGGREALRLDEALIPSRAMRLAWRGNFEGAYRLLVSNAERVTDTEQRCSRWSQTAVYAAAAHMKDEACAAAAVAQDALRIMGGAPGANLVRARLNLGLASLLSGEVHFAHELLAATERAAAPLPRLRKFHALLRAMLLFDEDARTSSDVVRLVEAMHDIGLGGIARIIEELPILHDAAVGCAS